MIIAGIIGLALLVLICLVAFLLCLATFYGAIALLRPASEQGFLGFAAYVAMWVFLFPVMLIICIFVGGLRMLLGTEWE